MQHVTQRYGQVTVVFDGYEEGPSTKDCAHQRRSGVSGPSVKFDGDMVLKLKKDVFLRNSADKQRLIKLHLGRNCNFRDVILSTPQEAQT